MRRFSRMIEIDAPAGRVWQVMSDVERWPEWTPSVTRIRRLGGGEFAPGARLMIHQPKFPPALWTLTELEPGRAFTWVSPAPGFRVIARHGVQPTASGSRATLSLEIEGPLGGIVARMTRGITERYLDYEVRGLKRRSEDASYRHGARAGEDPSR